MAKVTVLLDEPIGTINPNLYGHFVEHLGSCIYDGVWVGRQLCEQVVQKLRRVSVPVLRWPGGCFADNYHWRDGIGPYADRPRRVNTSWGNVIDDNSFGTHEFMRLCRALGARPYLAGNVGSGSPAELRDWVEYCNHPGGSTLSDERAANGDRQPFGVRYWGVGNEAWGCGGHFTPEQYAEEYRRFATFMRDVGTPPHLIACGPDANDLDWTERFFCQLQRQQRFKRIHGYAAHYYCGSAGTATQFTEGQWYELLYKATLMETLITQQRQLMDRFDPGRKIDLIVDEWGTWHPPTPGRNPAFLWQQNTLRDALVAGLTLDIFNRHADKLAMANIAQTVNVLQALLLTEGDRVITTPTYHVFDLYQHHQGGQSLRVEVDASPVLINEGPEMRRLASLSGSASRRQNTLTLTLVNVRLGEQIEAQITMRGASAAVVQQRSLTHIQMMAHNSFEIPETVVPTRAVVRDADASSFHVVIPAQSVNAIEIVLGG